jgi:hypothetical protein
MSWSKGGKQLGVSDYGLTTAKRMAKREFLSEIELVEPWQAPNPMAC